MSAPTRNCTDDISVCLEIRLFLSYSVRTIAGSSNGRTPPFEGGYWGSNPWPAANDLYPIKWTRPLVSFVSLPILAFVLIVYLVFCLHGHYATTVIYL